MKVPYVQMIMNGRRQAALGHSLKRGVIRRGLTLGLAAGLWLALLPTQAAADVTQSTWTKWYSVSFGERAQTFTAPSAGGLDHVSLMLNFDYGYGSSGTADVRNVDATTLQPTGAALPGSVVDLHGPTATYAYPFFKFPFASPIPVTGGKKYAIVMTITAGVRSWAGVTSAPPQDPGGRAWTAPGCVSACSSWSSTGYFPYDFAFEAGLPTAPAPGGDSAPTVKANTNPASATEGAIPTNAGTFSDPDGDTVTLSASSNTGSAGTVTPSGTGTWSWKGAAADEGQGQTITIIADDGHGNTGKAQFTTVVENALPKATISGAPTSAPEGTTINLTASAISPSAEDTAGVFTYTWSATNYDTKLPDGSGPSYSLTTDDEGIYTITLIATDDGGVPSPKATDDQRCRLEARTGHHQRFPIVCDRASADAHVRRDLLGRGLGRGPRPWVPGDVGVGRQQPEHDRRDRVLEATAAHLYGERDLHGHPDGQGRRSSGRVGHHHSHRVDPGGGAGEGHDFRPGSVGIECRPEEQPAGQAERRQRLAAAR